MDRASTWAPGSMSPGLNSSMWSPDVLAGLYYGWNMAQQQQPGSGQPTDPLTQQGAAANASRRGTPPGPGTGQGDWRSVVQAAAAAASQLEISKLSGSKSARSLDLSEQAPLTTPLASLGKAQTAPAANFGVAHAPARFNEVMSTILHQEAV